MAFQSIFRVALGAVAFTLTTAIGIAAPIGDPTQIGGNVLWLDGDDVDGNGVAGGSFVGGNTWVDKSLDAHHDNMITSGGAPSAVSGGVPFSGRSVVQFNGSSDAMANSSTNYTARSVFIVFRPDSTKQSNADLGQLWGRYSLHTQVAIDARSGVNLKGYSFDGNAPSPTTASYALGSSPFIGPFADNNAQPWVYNAAQMLSTIFTTDQTMTAHEISNLDSIANHQFGGQLAEIVVYDHVLTDGSIFAYDNELNDVQFYLQEKWGLNLGLTATPSLPAPEPASLLLVSLGAWGLLAQRRRRNHVPRT
jgi:hypothetical protein